MDLAKENRKNDKPRYESPVIVPLGEVAKGAGGNCAPTGTSDAGGCHAGGTPT